MNKKSLRVFAERYAKNPDLQVERVMFEQAANPATVIALLDENAALLEALKGMVQLDREHHQRGDDDIDISHEVQSAYNAIAKAESAS